LQEQVDRESASIFGSGQAYRCNGRSGQPNYGEHFLFGEMLIRTVICSMAVFLKCNEGVRKCLNRLREIFGTRFFASALRLAMVDRTVRL
jgi:hypothetical protein